MRISYHHSLCVVVKYFLQIKTLCQHLPFTWKSICLPRKLAIFIFSEQKAGVLLTESNVCRKIILASGCFMKIVTVQLVWRFFWLKWAHGFDMKARAKTIIHLLQQTQESMVTSCTWFYLISKADTAGQTSNALADTAGQTLFSAFLECSCVLNF